MDWSENQKILCDFYFMFYIARCDTIFMLKFIIFIYLLQV